jgi:hypothetical protein
VIRLLPGSAGYRWGSTPRERAQPYPGDGLLPDPDDVVFRAITIRARPEVAFRWLCQLRVAPYSYDWLDNRGHRSPRMLTAGLDQLAVGQRFMEIFALAGFEPGAHLTLTLDHAGSSRLFGQLVVSYVVTATPAGESRLLVKLLARRPRRAPFAWMAPLLPWGDLVMMRRQLRTLRDLAERTG